MCVSTETATADLVSKDILMQSEKHPKIARLLSPGKGTGQWLTWGRIAFFKIRPSKHRISQQIS